MTRRFFVGIAVDHFPEKPGVFNLWLAESAGKN
jgi:hypothetical protein